MSDRVNRRAFLKTSALNGAVATGATALSPNIGCAVESSQNTSEPSPAGNKSLTPQMLLNGTASLSKPSLAASQVSFRLGMARTRTTNYPLDSMDFIMIDLERPDGRVRHADWCTGDLSGRLLEFLSCAEGVDGKTDPRLDPLFDRILKQRRPSGNFGRYASSPTKMQPEKDPLRSSCAARLFPGLIRYFDLTGDTRALSAANGLAGQLWAVRDTWRNALQGGGNPFYAWVCEPFARLYGITKDRRWLEFCGMIRDNVRTCEAGCHAHGFMSTLRGLQVAALVTGDPSWNEKPEQNRQLILEKHFATPDGCTPEGFPHSSRNEGCSIADWMMLNLNAGLILGDDAAYDTAERIFWNALAFNQWITGSFGCREMTGNGYGLHNMEEAWWCCVHNGGMAISEYARHAVTFRNGAVCLNLLVPGQFVVRLPGDKWAKVTIATGYPTNAQATIVADSLPADVPLKLRVPVCVRKPEVNQTRTGERVRMTLRGEIGHRIEQCNPGVMLTYGPLILVPATWSSELSAQHAEGNATVPTGYIPKSVPAGVPTMKLDVPPDTDGFVNLPTCPPMRPLPEFPYYDEGSGSSTWVEGSAVEVQLKFPNGEVRPTRFTPMCYNTSNLSLFETPVVFHGVE